MNPLQYWSKLLSRAENTSHITHMEFLAILCAHYVTTLPDTIRVYLLTRS